MNCIDDSGHTPFLAAVSFRHEGLVKLLLEQNANPDAKCIDGIIILYILTLTTQDSHL